MAGDDIGLQSSCCKFNTKLSDCNMLKTVQTVDETNYVSWCEVGVNEWKGETISTISVCALLWKYNALKTKSYMWNILSKINTYHSVLSYSET